MFDRATRLKVIACWFGSFVAIGAALLGVDGGLAGGAVGPARLTLLVLGSAGVIATLAFSRRLPLSRPVLLFLLGLATLVVVAGLGGGWFFLLQSPAETFRKGKAATVVVGALITAVALAFLGSLLQEAVRDEDEAARRDG